MFMPNLIGWIVFGLVLAGLELLIPGLFIFLSFAVGAGAAAAVTWLGSPFICQAGTFCVAALLSCLGLWVWAKGSSKQAHQYRSAIDALPGKKGVVISSIAPAHVGQILVEGQVWSAQSLHGEALHKGAVVTVVKVEGVRLIVVSTDTHS